MDNINKVKIEYFNFFCSIEAYTKFNGILDITNNNTIQIMLKYGDEWSNEFQQKYFLLLEKNLTIDEYIDCITAITTSSKNYNQLYLLLKIIIKDINNKKYKDDFLIDFFYKLILLEMPFLTSFNSKISNLYDYLRKEKLFTDLNKLLNYTKIIIADNNNQEYLYSKNKVLKVIKKYKKYESNKYTLTEV